MILCDTNVLIELFKNNATIISTLKRITQKQIAISVITEAELYFGAFNKNELRAIQKNLLSISIIPVTANISNRFIGLMEQYSLSHNITIPDAIIAATALEMNYKLFTLNTKDFQFIDELILYNSQS